MTTRSGTRYKPIMAREGGGEGAGELLAATTDEGAAPLANLVRLLMEDRQRRDEELAEERRRREAEAVRRETEVRQQMELLTRLVESSSARTSTTGAARTESDEGERSRAGRDKVVLTKYVEGDDVEAYLTTFERVMTVHGVDQRLWVVHLAPQLAGRAQQAYAALPAEKAGDYSEVKKAILRRYDISPETYRQKFRAAKKKDYEAYAELATRLQDLAEKWLTGCDTVSAVLGKVVL